MARYQAKNFLSDQYSRIEDPSTHSTTCIEGAKIAFYDDFNNTTIWTTTEHGPWLLKDTHADATEAIVANTSGGAVGLHIGVTDAEQEAGLTFGDALTFNLDKGLVFECRAALHVLPTLLTECYFGIAGAYVKGTLAAADQGPLVHAAFMFDGSGTCTIHTDDASADNNAIATGSTVLADAYHVFRIDVHSVASVKFYIDGARVGSATTFSMANGTNVTVQPYFMVYKSAGAGLGDLYIDYCRMWQLGR